MPPGIVRRLGDEGDERARCRGGQRRRAAAPSSSIRPVARGEPGEGAQQRGLAGAVGPDDRDPVARADGEVDAVERRRAPSSSTRDAGRRTIAGLTVTPIGSSRRTSTKNGAPTKAVMTPIGISAGASDGAGDEVGEAQERAAEDGDERQDHAGSSDRPAGARCGGR